MSKLPVGPVVGGRYVAVDLQSRLVVHISQSVTFQGFIGGGTAKQRLDVERRQLQRPAGKSAVYWAGRRYGDAISQHFAW